jgi:hypothetical protein
MLREDWWRYLARGIYQTAPTDPTWNGLAWAGVLIGGDRARLGPEASGFLHNLVDDAPRPIDVLVPMGAVHGSEATGASEGSVRARDLPAPSRTRLA